MFTTISEQVEQLLKLNCKEEDKYLLIASAVYRSAFEFNTTHQGTQATFEEAIYISQLINNTYYKIKKNKSIHAVLRTEKNILSEYLRQQKQQSESSCLGKQFSQLQETLNLTDFLVDSGSQIKETLEENKTSGRPSRIKCTKIYKKVPSGFKKYLITELEDLAQNG